MICPSCHGSGESFPFGGESFGICPACDGRGAIQEEHAMISDTEARRIASEWHGGGGTALYAFASTGAIDTARRDHDLKTEIVSNLRWANEAIPTSDSPTNLVNLLGYVYEHGQRGPQPGWGELTW